MIQLTAEDHAAAAALAAKMKAEFPTVAPKIAIAAVQMLTLEIAVHLSNGNKKAAIDYVKAMAHDGRDAIRAYFRAVEERKKATGEKLKAATEAVGEAHSLALGTKETV